MKHIKLIQDLLDNEIWDYSYEYDIECDYDEENDEQYTVKITDKYWGKTIGSVCFRTDWEKIEVELWEDNWQKIEHYEWTIKYFWMALLT